MAMTTALSPERSRSIQTICSTETRKLRVEEIHRRFSIRSEGQGVGTSGPPLESGEHAVSKGTRHIVPKPVQCKLQSRLRV